MNTTTLVWGDDLGGVKAQVGNVTYYIGNAYGGFETYLMMRGLRGGTRRLNLGNFKTLDDAKQKCEQHYGDGCNVSAAGRWW
jgi:hypothetical protein